MLVSALSYFVADNVTLGDVVKNRANGVLGCSVLWNRPTIPFRVSHFIFLLHCTLLSIGVNDGLPYVY